ncbi:hypothetical protein TNCV_3040821 [Trichonephila clavipes]|nr:hypothetical protein TNCV_3040821 [Trichonephila clavipes]
MQMSRSGGQSGVRPSVSKSPSKLLVLIYQPTAVGMKAIRVLLVTDLVIFNYGQATRVTPEMVPPPKFHTTPTGRRLSIDRFKCITLLHDGSSAVLGSTIVFRHDTFHGT